MSFVGAAIERVDLVGVDTEEEMLERALSDYGDPQGEWIIGRGWTKVSGQIDILINPFSKLIPDHPVFLSSLHGFAGLANQKALDAVGINAETKFPLGRNAFR